MFRTASKCESANCVEVDTEFRPALACESNQCVEVLTGEYSVAIRNNKHPEQVVVFDHDEWRVFLAGAKAGEFDVKGLADGAGDD